MPLKTTSVAIVIAAAFVAAVCADDAEKLSRFSRTGVQMGVEFEVVLYAAGEEQAKAAFDQAFARIAALDRALSDYDPESELSKLSESSMLPPGRPASDYVPRAIKLSDDLWTVLSAAQEVSRQSDGAFDVTIGPLTKLWRRARRQKELPTPERIAQERQAVGYRHLVLDPEKRTAMLLKPNMRLDLGGIAKGYATDEALAEIKRTGPTRALVRASGDIASGDPPPGESGWKVGIAPLDPDEPPTTFVRLANRSISTSGDSRQHLVIDGKRYSHLIDPRSGFGISGRSSVTVIAPRDMQADALDSAVSILGPDRGLTLVREIPDCELLMVYEDESGRQKTVETEGFKRLVSP